MVWSSASSTWVPNITQPQDEIGVCAHRPLRLLLIQLHVVLTFKGAFTGNTNESGVS